MNTFPKLKPCPFCGAKVEMKKQESLGYNPERVFAECKPCGIRFEESGIEKQTRYGPSYDMADAIKKLEKRWNTRH